MILDDGMRGYLVGRADGMKEGLSSAIAATFY